MIYRFSLAAGVAIEASDQNGDSDEDEDEGPENVAYARHELPVKERKSQYDDEQTHENAPPV